MLIVNKKLNWFFVKQKGKYIFKYDMMSASICVSYIFDDYSICILILPMTYHHFI